MRERIRWFLSGVLVTVLILAMGITAYAAYTKQATLYYNNIKVTLDGKKLSLTDANGRAVDPFIINGTTYLPVRAISSGLGLGVDWDGSTSTVKLTSGSGQQQSGSYGKQHKVGRVGSYNVSIKNASMIKDYEGKNAIAISYSWTNNSSKTVCAMIALNIEAFQDGVELEDSFPAYNSSFDEAYNNTGKNIRPGTTLDAVAIFKLRDNTSPVEVEFSSFTDFSNNPSIVYSSFGFN